MPAIGAALQDGPLACVGQANGPLSVSGSFAGFVAMAARRFRSIRRKMQFTMIPIFKKNAVLGDFYLRKSAEFC